MSKIRLDVSIDENLMKIVKNHCHCEKIYVSYFIADLISEKLDIPLDKNRRVDQTLYTEYQIREIDNCIDKLKKQRQKLEAKL